MKGQGGRGLWGCVHISWSDWPRRSGSSAEHSEKVAHSAHFVKLPSEKWVTLYLPQYSIVREVLKDGWNSQLCGFSKMKWPRRVFGQFSAATANSTDLFFSYVCGNTPFYPKEARFLRNQCNTDGWKRDSNSKRNEIFLWLSKMQVLVFFLSECEDTIAGPCSIYTTWFTSLAIDHGCPKCLRSRRSVKRTKFQWSEKTRGLHSFWLPGQWGERED